MSKEEMLPETTHDTDTPRLEPWLLVMLTAIVPMVVALVVGKEFVLHFATVSGILFVAGLAMFIAQERRRR
jgi:hypothetical protein